MANRVVSQSWRENRLTSRLGLQPPIIQGPLGGLSSQLPPDVFGWGRTSVRSSLGVARLPLGAPVLLEVTFEVNN